MKRSFISIVFLVVIFSVFAGGKVIESIEMKSNLMQYPVKYSVYLPEDYDTSQRSYPVIYLLHGSSDDETSWVQLGEVNRYLNESIKNGDISPSIVILPDAKLTRYSNEVGLKNKWRDMFINELIPIVEKKYRIRSNREFRAIVGNSMGGFGALSLTLNYPELFSTCVAMSGAFYSDDDLTNMSDESYAEKLGTYCGENLKGNDRITSNWKAISPFHLLDKTSKPELNSIRCRLDCGNLDRFLKVNYQMHIKMDEYKIKHEFIVRNGNHGWSYWRESLPETFKFIGVGFRR
jgi:enterochelin esterase-like enzyme